MDIFVGKFNTLSTLNRAERKRRWVELYRISQYISARKPKSRPASSRGSCIPLISDRLKKVRGESQVRPSTCSAFGGGVIKLMTT